MYFAEQPMSCYAADEGRKRGATALMFSNRHFDPVAGSGLCSEYLEEYQLAEEVGFAPRLRAGAGQPALQRVPRALSTRRGSRLRRHHAERASQRAVLHAGQ